MLRPRGPSLESETFLPLFLPPPTADKAVNTQPTQANSQPQRVKQQKQPKTPSHVYSQNQLQSQRAEKQNAVELFSLSITLLFKGIR